MAQIIISSSEQCFYNTWSTSKLLAKFCWSKWKSKCSIINCFQESFPLKGLRSLLIFVGISSSVKLGLLGRFSCSWTLKPMSSSLTQEDNRHKTSNCSIIPLGNELETYWKGNVFSFNNLYSKVLSSNLEIQWAKLFGRK